MSGRPTVSITEFSSPAPFFLVRNTVSVRLRTVVQIVRIAMTDRFSQSPQPVARPGKFDAENRKPDRDHDDSRPRRHDHQESNQENRGADDADGDAARGFVREMNRSLDQDLPQCFCFCRVLP